MGVSLSSQQVQQDRVTPGQVNSPSQVRLRETQNQQSNTQMLTPEGQLRISVYSNLHGFGL